METAKIAALLAAAELGSISKAAENLGYTQSGVTHIVNSLEEEAGFPLLMRGNRGVRLTAEGERLAPLMRELVQTADRLEQELALTRGATPASPSSCWRATAPRWRSGSAPDA